MLPQHEYKLLPQYKLFVHTASLKRHAAFKHFSFRAIRQMLSNVKSRSVAAVHATCAKHIRLVETYNPMRDNQRSVCCKNCEEEKDCSEMRKKSTENERKCRKRCASATRASHVHLHILPARGPFAFARSGNMPGVRFARRVQTSLEAQR